MKGEKTQPTPISAEEYQRFKQWVQDTHGTTRGHLSTEIENALREYRQPSNDRDVLHRIESDVATIMAQVVDGEADGGTDLSAPEVPARAESEKPRPNAPRSEKVEWFIGDRFDRDGGDVTIGALKSMLKSEFGFSEGVLEEYRDLIVAELDAKPHPEFEGRLCWGEKLADAKQAQRDAARKESEEHFGGGDA